MDRLCELNAKNVFKYFYEISRIPRGSGDMERISDYCMEFAKAHSLKAVRDSANNVIIYKDATVGYEDSETVILQGHLDMVCQKTKESEIDFTKDGLEVFLDGDFLKARGTTLGADNGIAVAMILAVLESNDISHPAIEALFTTDEEIGMIGAAKFDAGMLKGRRMINIDSEDEGVLTVSCAGGSEVEASISIKRIKKYAKRIRISLKGLKGGHSGVEINSGRINADILSGRVLNYLNNKFEFDIISINGGDKGNAIPLCCEIELLISEPYEFLEAANEYFNTIKKEIKEREPEFLPIVEMIDEGEFNVMDEESKDKLIFVLLNAPNGICQMSKEIEGLVETSLNLGILKTEADKIKMNFTLRSNKQSALDALEERLTAFFKYLNCTSHAFGHYPPWEFRENSLLQALYKEVFKEKFGYDVKVCAIHAGLECGILSAKLDNLDCISIGPQMYDVHTVDERLCVLSTENIFEVLINLLKRIK